MARVPLCANQLFITFYFKPHQHQSTMNESLSGGEHELVSTSLTVATLPLLVITRGRSQSLTNELPQGPRGKDGLLSHRSDSFDSLHFGRLSSASPGLPAGVPRIIVISPTSESRLIKHDSACLEESVEALEDSVFTSLNFSSEVFQAVELLSWPTSFRWPFHRRITWLDNTKHPCVSCPDYQSVEELWAQQQYDPALACSVQRWGSSRDTDGPRGSMGCSIFFLDPLKMTSATTYFPELEAQAWQAGFSQLHREHLSPADGSVTGLGL